MTRPPLTTSKRSSSTGTSATVTTKLYVWLPSAKRASRPTTQNPLPSSWQDAVSVFEDLRLPDAAELRAKLGNLAAMTGSAIADDRGQIASTT